MVSRRAGFTSQFDIFFSVCAAPRAKRPLEEKFVNNVTALSPSRSVDSQLHALASGVTGGGATGSVSEDKL